MGKNIDPWTCEKCGARVFVDEKIHVYVCHLYRGIEGAVGNTHLTYNKWFLENSLKKTRKKGKEF